MKKILILILGTLCLQYCFNPDLTHVMFACDAEKPECPAGMKCISNRCQVPDVADMSQFDQQLTDLSRGPGCVSGGMQVGSAWACPGPFDSMTKRATSLCNVGFSICKDALLVDQTACNKLQDFYAAQVPTELGSPIQCRFASMTNARGWAGCGIHMGAVFPSANKCGGFDKAVDCGSIAWTCPTDQLNDATVKTALQDGVLCCPM